MAFSTPLARFLASAFAIALLITPSADAITCVDVLNNLIPCIGYLTSGSGGPSGTCCAGARSLASTAKSVADRRTACGCLKTAANTYKLKPEIAKSLPAKCGIKLPFEVSPNVDCSKIK
ncbi:Non-specific lipid-transfer protein 8 [Striga hermonthica]|uniref:Non-specific lipid-transfer protein n=1 Tax=Striga hermonthica TaxID=68872 RepID=A0A9N7N587_STRHE|nr:Non-specific lipid-transfer protein 8 [Striga hermonthica]